MLLATFASLRFGEVTALERADLDLELGTVAVRRAFVEVRGKGLVVGPPKSRAGLRVVSIPPSVVEALRNHLAEHAGPGALVFTVPAGAPVRRGNFNKLVGWREKVEQLGLKGVRFHDLRHTGNTLAARSGVSTRDLMSRMGHDSMQAALGYQHARATRTMTAPPGRSTPMTITPTTRIKPRVTTRATRTMTAPPGRSFRPGDGGRVARVWPMGRFEPARKVGYRRGRGRVTRAGARRAGDEIELAFSAWETHKSAVAVPAEHPLGVPRVALVDLVRTGHVAHLWPAPMQHLEGRAVRSLSATRGTPSDGE